MTHYIARRLLLLPLTLFAILIVNFLILNLAPGDPVTITSMSATGEASRNAQDGFEPLDNQYLLFREHYGLTLPILFNLWPSTSLQKVSAALEVLEKREERSVQSYQDNKRLLEDKSRFIMSHLLKIAADPLEGISKRRRAANLFIRGGTKFGHIGPYISDKQREENRRISKSNLYLSSMRIEEGDSLDRMEEKVASLILWFKMKENQLSHVWSTGRKLQTFFFEARFARYLSRVLTLDFGTLRSDSNKTVLSEVLKRMKYSMTLAVIPMILTFALCQIFGMWMAVRQNQWQDHSLNIFFLILFAIPVFVVAPFLIEKIALHHHVPFSDIPVPYSGFHSSQNVYEEFTSIRRLFDILLHLLLPLLAIMYGTLAIQARLSRTAFLEVLRQDYIQTAKAKGLKMSAILIKHVGRCGSITIVTSLAASLGVILGGSLIVETIFEINGFGKFFYEAIQNRDYNVVLFSALAGSLITLVGFLIADIAYTLLDPRIKLE